MSEAALRLSLVDPEPDEGVYQMEMLASNGRFSATQELYLTPEDFGDFSEALTHFPRNRHEQITFEVGKPIQFDHVRLTVRIVDNTGHPVIEVVVSNAGKDQHRAEAVFNIPCEVAAINRLGAELKRWISAPDRPMMWQPEPERL